jgi:hypothetical protein
MNQKDNTNNKKSKEEWRTITDIKNKMTENNLTIAKADKGKTLVILTQEEYKQKITNFIQDNKYIKINNPTQQYQRKVKQTLKQCNIIIPKESTWRYTNMNPVAPALHATIKLHNPNKPIRPIINWKGSPAYEIAKELTKTLATTTRIQHLQLQTPNVRTKNSCNQ